MSKNLGHKTRAFLMTSAAAAAVVTGASLSAQAQDSSSDFTLEEILVTAQKRPQTLQETPIAVSVTDAATIEKSHILDISDMQSVVPSLRVWTLQTSSNTNFAIRGFGNGANNAGIEPSVGVFIDGVYRSRSAAQIGDLPRLQRVEVLRGPQSTLFGKNASAGVISIVTAAPSFEPEGGIEASYGNYDARQIKAYYTTGLTDTFAVSISGGVNKRDGYIETSDPNIDDINNRDRWNIRGQALWEPSETVSVRMIADYNELDELCCGVTNIINGPTAGLIQLLGGTVLDDSDPFAYESPINQVPVNKIKDGGVSLEANVDFEGFTLTSISSYRSNSSFNDSEPDYTGAHILDSAYNDADIDTYTQEIRLSSTGVNKLDWMVGGYFFKEDITQIQGLKYGTDTRNYIDFLTGAPGTLATLELLSGMPSGSFFAADTTTRETFTQDNTAFSLFASLDFHLTDRLTLTGGINYTKDKKTVTGSTVNGDAFSSIDLFTVNGGFIPTALFGQAFADNTGLAPTPENIAFIESVAPGTSAAINAGVTSAIQGLQGLQFQPQFLAYPNSVQDGKTNDDKVTWQARAAYEVSDNINIYLSAGTGFKSTSWNLSRDARPFAANQAALEAAGLTQVNQTYGTLYAGPENSTVYEIGIKARYSKGAINIALFDQTIKGFQSNIFQGTGFVLANAGKQSTKGLEIDATWVPIEDLEFRFAGTFLDPVFDSFPGAAGPNGTVVDLSGEKPAGIHETSLSFAATYFFELGDSMTGYVRGDWQYESETQVVDNVDGVFRQVSLFNASAGLEWENGLSLSVWGRNLFNDEFYLSAFPGVIQPGTVNGYANPPRMYGVSVGYKF
ncbi:MULTISPECIES: TonB-dependent receptor [Kordiimonas]|jgi:outer membrane receptor protein involved in Fe transport|uniref:TonB-dependent receptor n=1 Tax=Kordiimonas TaxID=288021 RepID=UPI00257978DB|nr:TonB-dependent receptor [Kordiimonas sp. UBA4487]